eukprot:CAMPEP_0119389536 /NCGR_PEP_ID=MMETSP1334-20130426/109871_1 /TAXON_ID=127549 /ORGANISM="Calcidiscus leptoporus, Strain RCC1130" /LENGTH=48 /DNA_ID= /DNA_START= /DNA_END= /DNA_ORIENTATION=
MRPDSSSGASNANRETSEHEVVEVAATLAAERSGSSTYRHQGRKRAAV